MTTHNEQGSVRELSADQNTQIDWPRPLGLNLSIEDLALIAVARKDLDERSFNLLHAVLHQTVDWRKLPDASEWHKLQGFLHKHLSRDEFQGHAPAEVVRVLEARYKRNVARHMFFEQETARVLNVLSEGGIDAILMKGAALVPDVYEGNAGLRPMADIDLIVRRDQAVDADQRLRRMGYRPSVDDQEQARMQEVDRQLAALARPGSPVIVEIHTHLVPTDSQIRFDIERLWQRRVASETGGASHFVLDPTATVAVQAVNFMKDRRFYSYSALGQLCDLSEVIRKYESEIEWQAFAKDGDLQELQGVVYGSVFLARHLLDAPVSDENLGLIEPSQFNTRMAAILTRDRVFGTDWLAKDIDSQGGVSKAWRLPFSMLRRIFLSKSQLEYRARPGETITTLGLLGHNVRRLGMAAKFAARSAVHPGRMYEDLSVDSWLKSLSQPGKN